MSYYDYPFVKEYTLSGTLSAIEHLCKKGGFNEAYLDVLLSKRLGGRHREEFVQHLSKVLRAYEVEGHFKRHIASVYKRVVEGLRGRLSDLEGLSYVLLSEIPFEPRTSLKNLCVKLKGLIGSLDCLHVPDLEYYVHVRSISPINFDDSELKDAILKLRGRAVFLDEYTARAVREVYGVDATSLSELLKRLIEEGGIKVKPVPKLRVGIVRPCFDILNEDLRRYLDILYFFPTIKYALSLECLPSHYAYRRAELFKPMLEEIEPEDLFGEKKAVVLTYDPQIYGMLLEALRGKLCILGFLPNLITFFLSRA